MAPPRHVDSALLNPELALTASRSDGPGGQNVNKVSTKITLRFNINGSSILTPDEKRLIVDKLASRITKDGELIISSQESRSQLQNKENVVRKFDALLWKAFAPEKVRKKTKPSKSSKEKRILSKKLVAEKKKWRKMP